MKIIKTSEALPKSGRYVLAWLEGAKIPMRAMWAAQHTLPLGDDADPEWGEYSEEKDEYFCPAGWYEMNQHEEQHWSVDGNVVAWCELPRLDHQCLAQIAEPAGAAPAAVAPQGTKFFSASNEGLDEHDTAEAAQNEAQSIIDMYREEAADGWPEEVDSVCWGVILGKAVERPVKDAPFMGGIAGSDMEPVDYVLEPVAAPALEAPSAYNSAGPIKRYMLDCNIDGMDQFREFILATDHDTLVHDVLANADPAGTVQENGLLRDQVRQLDAMVGRMKREAAAPQAPAAPAEGEVLVEVIGLTGSGKSAICGEIEILCRALGLDVSWPDGDPEKNITHAEWTAAIEAYKPRVRIVERNVPRQSNGGPAK